MATYIFYCIILVYLLSPLTWRNKKNQLKEKTDIAKRCGQSLSLSANYDLDMDDLRNFSSQCCLKL